MSTEPPNQETRIWDLGYIMGAGETKRRLKPIIIGLSATVIGLVVVVVILLNQIPL